MEEYAMYTKSIQGGAFRSLVETLKELLHDVALTFDKEGIRLCCLDGSRCALVWLRLEAASFEEYHCPGKISCGINLLSLYKLLRSTGTQDTVVMYVLKDSESELGIRVLNADKNAATSYKLRLLDIDEEMISMDPVVFDSVMTLPSAYFQRMCRDMLSLSDTMMITSMPDGSLVISCVGDFASQVTIIGEKDDVMSVESRASKEISGKFSLKYLSLFARASALANTMVILMRENYPIILKYSVASLGELRLCLAPKVNE
jgi:proliferating cell nuclear antigen